LGACLAATVAKIPIAHIHGGECSFGSFDDQIRHAVTKLAHLHFAATEEYASRLQHMGERRVWVMGAPGLDNLRNMPPRRRGKYFVLTFHPATTADEDPRDVVAALGEFPEYGVVWTGVNNDPGSDLIRGAFPWPETPLDGGGYVAACRGAAAIIGNSSSGLIEAPVMKVPTVNIGRRQDGRSRGPSVVDVPMGGIVGGIRKVLEYTGPFDSPYGGFGASRRIANVLATADLELSKPWHW